MSCVCFKNNLLLVKYSPCFGKYILPILDVGLYIFSNKLGLSSLESVTLLNSKSSLIFSSNFYLFSK